MRRMFVYSMTIFAAVILFSFAVPATAYAYINLGPGSYIIQLIIGTLVGLSFMIKIYWKKVKSFLASCLFKR